MTIKHDDVIDWPNGLGFTPCSFAYRQKLNERDGILIVSNDCSVDDLSSEDYNLWHMLDNELSNMQANGHTGKGERF